MTASGRVQAFRVGSGECRQELTFRRDIGRLSNPIRRPPTTGSTSPLRELSGSPYASRSSRDHRFKMSRFFFGGRGGRCCCVASAWAFSTDFGAGQPIQASIPRYPGVCWPLQLQHLGCFQGLICRRKANCFWSWSGSGGSNGLEKSDGQADVFLPAFLWRQRSDDGNRLLRVDSVLRGQSIDDSTAAFIP